MEVDRTLASRYELKYIVRRELVPLLRNQMSPFMQPDRFAALANDASYWISSLYLDSPDFSLYRGTIEGHKNRFKLRIRTYSDDSDDPAFFEIKRRSDKVIRKTRTQVDRRLAGLFLAGSHPAGARHPRGSSAGYPQEFLNLALRCGARPVARVRYRREAYEDAGGGPLRITFDTQLACVATPDGDLSHNGPGWQNINPGGVILEIKFTGGFPSWVAEMVRRFELRKQSVPKYIMSVQKAFKPGDSIPAIISVTRRTTNAHSRGA